MDRKYEAYCRACTTVVFGLPDIDEGYQCPECGSDDIDWSLDKEEEHRHDKA